MPGKEPDFVDLSQQHQMALSRWDTEGGAGPGGPQKGSISGAMQSEIPHLTNAELVQLRVRVIAIENLVIALLAESTIGSSTLFAKWRRTSLQDQAPRIIL